MKNLVLITEKKSMICIVDHGHTRREAVTTVLRNLGYSKFVKCSSYSDIHDIQKHTKIDWIVGTLQANAPENALIFLKKFYHVSSNRNIPFSLILTDSFLHCLPKAFEIGILRLQTPLLQSPKYASLMWV